MTPRTRAILIVGLALFLVALIIAGILLLRSQLAPPAEGPGPGQEPAPIEEPVGVVQPTFDNPLILPEPEAQGNTGARQMAELFAERYGSYSNQGEYQNLRDLMPVMTASYRQETEAFLASAPAGSAGNYEGVTSVKISTDVRASDADSAVIAVTLQQTRRSGGAAPTIGYRTLRMELELVGDAWRVDDAAWEN